MAGMFRRLGVTWADSFTRANQSGLGNGWTLGNGTAYPAIVSNAAAATTAATGYHPALYPAQARTDRYYVQVTLDGTPSSVAVAVLIRCNIGFTQQVGCFVASTGTSILYVQNATASTATTEASNSTTWASGNYFTVTCAGNVYTAWKSTTPTWQTGTNILSWTDSSNVVSTGLGNRYGGISCQYDGTTLSVPVQNFVMSDY